LRGTGGKNDRTRKENELPHRPLSHSDNCEDWMDFMALTDELNKLLRLIMDLVEKKFYGTFEVKFEHGLIVNVKKIENIKL
jgi:hypothetical protein